MRRPPVPLVNPLLPAPLQVEAAAAGADEAAVLHARVLLQQHAEPRGPDHPGHEHRPALHEGPGQQDAR